MPANHGQKPTQIFTPRNTILLITSLLIIMLLSSFIGYIVAQKTSTKSTVKETSSDNKMMSDTAKSPQTQITTANTSSNPALVAPKDTAPTTTTPVAVIQPEAWTGEITLKPKNADKFKKEVSILKFEGCGNPGVVSFTEPEKYYKQDNAPIAELPRYNGSEMIIINKNLKPQGVYKDSFKLALDNLENGSNSSNKDFLGSIKNSFSDSCFTEGDVSASVKQSDILQNIDYSSYRIYSSLFNVSIIAQRGDNIILFQKPSSYLQTTLTKKCDLDNEREGYGFTKKGFDCLILKSKDLDIQNEVSIRAQELLTIFAL